MMKTLMMDVSNTVIFQLVEGERKAVFEDCEREKEENKEKIKKLKEEIKQIKNEVGRVFVIEVTRQTSTTTVFAKKMQNNEAHCYGFSLSYLSTEAPHHMLSGTICGKAEGVSW